MTECEYPPPPVAGRAIDALTSMFHEQTALPWGLPSRHACSHRRAPCPSADSTQRSLQRADLRLLDRWVHPPPSSPSVTTGCATAPIILQSLFTRLTTIGVEWADGTHAEADAIIWCTGFRPALSHLAPLGLRGPHGHIPTTGTQALGEPRLHLLGYSDWTGPASATLIRVGRPARDATRDARCLPAVPQSEYGADLGEGQPGRLGIADEAEPREVRGGAGSSPVCS